MPDALSISPPAADVPHRAADGAAPRGRASANPDSGARRIERREQVALAPGIEFAYAIENIAAPTQWTVQHARHTLIVHLDGAMRRLDTRIEGAGRLHATPAVGDLWLIPAGRRYLGRALGGDIAYAEFTIDPTQFAACAPQLSDGEVLAARMKHRDPFVHGLTTRLAHLSQASDDLAAMLRQSLGQALCLHLLREHGARAAHAQMPMPASALNAVQRRRVEDYIHAHLDERITLETLSRVAGLSTHRLLTAFRGAFGVTPIQYVLDQRLRQVCVRLRAGTDDIASIALETGFSSHSHLSALFKKRFGLTPNQYRLGG